MEHKKEVFKKIPNENDYQALARFLSAKAKVIRTDIEELSGLTVSHVVYNEDVHWAFTFYFTDGTFAIFYTNDSDVDICIEDDLREYVQEELVKIQLMTEEESDLLNTIKIETQQRLDEKLTEEQRRDKKKLADKIEKKERAELKRLKKKYGSGDV